MTLVAAVQLSCTSDRARNDAALQHWVRHAASLGAQFIATPENTNFLGPHDEKVRIAEPLDGPLIQGYQALARELSVTLLIGSVNERSDDTTRCYNTSVLIGPDGSVLSSYRKMHLFDVDVSDEVRFLESTTTVAGDQPVVTQTPVGKIGLSICYDLRFPELYRRLVEEGAQLLAVPSAFTQTTGMAHWEPLLRARAIENQAYVIAPGQVGEHDDNGLRHSWGHSMIIDPWGDIIGMASSGEGLALANIDLTRVAQIRRGMPVSTHRRL